MHLMIKAKDFLTLKSLGVGINVQGTKEQAQVTRNALYYNEIKPANSICISRIY